MEGEHVGAGTGEIFLIWLWNPPQSQAQVEFGASPEPVRETQGHQRKAKVIPAGCASHQECGATLPLLWGCPLVGHPW